MVFCVVVYHGGILVTDPIVEYRGGTNGIINGQDPDKWSYFEAVGILREDFGYAGVVKLWWKGILDGDEFKELTNDAQATDMVAYAEANNGVVHMYVESKDGNEGMVADNFNDNNDLNEDNNSEESFPHVQLDDSEEERANAIDDGFEVGISEGQASGIGWVNLSGFGDGEGEGSIGGGVEGGGGECSVGGGVESGGSRGGAGGFDGTFVQSRLNDVGVIDEGYESEILPSDKSGSEDENCDVMYPQFNKEHMGKNFQFKLGMEFGSLSDFKEAILEHSVLNGREVRFKKNDKERALAVCKHVCDFKAYVSRVGTSHTFRLKTYNPKHTCGRVFNNSNANSNWIAKVLVNKLKATTNDLTLKDIIGEIRCNYSTGITMSRARRAKAIAKRSVEGDARKQYTQLWSYAAELRRSCPGNTCLLKIERPTPALLPHFGSFYMCLDGPKQAFKSACRPLIGVDGCHLKTKYGGQLLIAVGRDPNDQYMPIAFAVVENETKESWKWFMNLLLEDLGDLNTNRYVFISDQQKVNSKLF